MIREVCTLHDVLLSCECRNFTKIHKCMLWCCSMLKRTNNDDNITLFFILFFMFFGRNRKQIHDTRRWWLFDFSRKNLLSAHRYSQHYSIQDIYTFRPLELFDFTQIPWERHQRDFHFISFLLNVSSQPHFWITWKSMWQIAELGAHYRKSLYARPVASLSNVKWSDDWRVYKCILYSISHSFKSESFIYWFLSKSWSILHHQMNRSIDR